MFAVVSLGIDDPFTHTSFATASRTRNGFAAFAFGAGHGCVGWLLALVAQKEFGHAFDTTLKL